MEYFSYNQLHSDYDLSLADEPVVITQWKGPRRQPSPLEYFTKLSTVPARYLKVQNCISNRVQQEYKEKGAEIGRLYGIRDEESEREEEEPERDEEDEGYGEVSRHRDTVVLQGKKQRKHKPKKSQNGTSVVTGQ